MTAMLASWILEAGFPPVLPQWPHGAQAMGDALFQLASGW